MVAGGDRRSGHPLRPDIAGPSRYCPSPAISASAWLTFWTILFPLLRPCTASMVISSGLGICNDFLDPLIIRGPLHGVTIMTGIYTALGQLIVDYGQMFAMMLVAALPVLVFFLTLLRQFIRGLTNGAMKG